MTSVFSQHTLGEICDVLDKLRKPITKKDRVAGEYPYYGATGILDYVEGYLFDEKLILIGEDGAKWGVGENTAFSADGKYWVNNHAHVIRPHRDTVLDQWIIYYLNAIDLSPFITGLTVPKLNQAKMRDIPIPLPPLPEQKRIVAILDEAFAGIDAAAANTEKNLANGRELFESYLNGVFTRKGEGWIEKKLGDVCEKVEYGTSSKSKPEGSIPVLRMGNIQGGQLDWTNLVYTDNPAEIEKYLLKNNDVLFNRTNSPELVGKAAIYKGERPAIFAGYLIRIHRKMGLIDAEFLNYYLNSMRAREYGRTVMSGSVNQANISGSKLKEYPIAIPSLKKQEELVALIRDLEMETMHLETIYQQKLAALAELKQAILQKAFAGELTAQPEQALEEAVA